MNSVLTGEQQARSELAELEARLRKLESSNARLADLLARPERIHGLVALGFVLATLAAGLGFALGARGVEQRYDRGREVSSRLHEERMEQERTVLAACKMSARKASVELAQCQGSRSLLELTPR